MDRELIRRAVDMLTNTVLSEHGPMRVETSLRAFKDNFPHETEFIEQCDKAGLEDATVIVLATDKEPAVLTDENGYALRFR